MHRCYLVLASLLVAACHSEIYVRDGVTDGNRYSIPESVLLSEDPVLQSWVAYNLSKSVCQLELGGDNPARANSYGCELSSRIILLDTWLEHRAEDSLLKDEYLDTLTAVRDAAFLDEYVVHYFGKADWFVPAEVDHKSFQIWRGNHLRHHSPYTRIVGVWGY
ncbi:MAG: hypothetical protein AB8G18_06350 [Gammaproteobacteria bacterium]